MQNRLKYINAYEVTRHYGGPEEGGWWYNSGEPVASVPVIIGPKPHWVPNWWGKRADGTTAYPDGGHINPCPDISRKDQDILDRETERLAALFDDRNTGNIYSMRGGAEMQYELSDKPGQPWPQERPYYC